MHSQTDGATAIRQPSQSSIRRPSIRRRIANLFRRRKSLLSTSADLSADREAKDAHADVDVEDASPMHLISPRSTNTEPATPQRKEHALSFLGRHSVLTPSVSDSRSVAKNTDVQEVGTSGAGGGIEGDAHVQSVMVPGQAPVRSLGTGAAGMELSMPASPSREAALRSHPVLRVEGSGGVGRV